MAGPRLAAASSSRSVNFRFRFLLKLHSKTPGFVARRFCLGTTGKGLAMGPGEGIRWALISLTGVGVLTGLLFWLAAKPFRAEMEG